MIILLIIIGAVFAASFAIITLRRKQYRARQKDVQIREDAAEKIRKSTEEILNNISSDFQSMPSWMDWDESVHRVGGQLDRIKRAACEDMSVLAYDPHYSMAKVAGNSGDIYLTSGKRCSCLDYRDRRLPCKHMYLLCMELDGESSKCIVDTKHKRLDGLTFALAGKFPGSANSPDGFRAKLNSFGAMWSDSVTRDCSAIVFGKNPSQQKIELAQYYDMELFKAEDIDNLFVQK